MTNAAGRKASPIYRVVIANPKKSDDAISQYKFGRVAYIVRKMMQARENVIKSGSDHAHKCSLTKGADDEKNITAIVVVKKLRAVAKYTTNATSPALIPKRMAFRRRAA
jgi:ribosomal protein S16